MRVADRATGTFALRRREASVLLKEIPVEFFQILISSIFSIIGAGSILFIAARSYSVGVDVAEMKELLKELRREAQHRVDGGATTALSVDPELGNWPSVTDPRYNPSPGELPYALRTPAESGQADVPNRPRAAQ